MLLPHSYLISTSLGEGFPRCCTGFAWEDEHSLGGGPSARAIPHPPGLQLLGKLKQEDCLDLSSGPTGVAQLVVSLPILHA